MKHNKFKYLAISFILSSTLFITYEQSSAFNFGLSRVDAAAKTDSIFLINLRKYGISNNNSNAVSTTNGINKAILDAKNSGYKRVQLPAGIYAIDTSIKNPVVLSDGTKTWTHNRQGIVMQSDMELILTGATLQIVPCEDPYYSILTISNCKNSTITGGTIIGDRSTHNYGLRINQSGTELESGSIDVNTGLPINDGTQVRTKNFISDFNGQPLPSNFYLSVLEKTSKNTVDGGVRYIYCYDNSGKYLGLTTGDNGFISKATLQPGTTKIKVAFKNEKRLDATYYLTNRTLYFTHEFGAGITIAASDGIQIIGTTIKDTIGDCIQTVAPPIKVTVDNLSIINCTLENARRQGISFVATGQNYLIKDTNIGNINGVDPQSGIDFEHYDYVKNVVIDGCNFYDNRKWDIINYNGQDIEVKNSNFTGGIASTYGWNMNIHDNQFSYRDITNNPKILSGVVLSLNTNKTNSDNAYFRVNNNSITGYSNAGSTSSLALSQFNGNKVYNTTNLLVNSVGCNSNYYENSSIRYSAPLVTNETYKNSTVYINDDKYNTTIQQSKFEDSQLMPRTQTTLLNSTIYNKTKPFGDTSAWWSLSRKVIFDTCSVTTEYTTSIPFLSNYQANTIFKNCNLNISRYPFSLNYGGIEFDNNQINFNDLNTSSSVVTFDPIGYGNATNYWKFTNNSISSKYPVKINSSNVLNNTINGAVQINN